MTKKYEASTMLVFWGDSLDSASLASDLRVNGVEATKKGQPLRLPDGKESGSVAKTGRLSCDFGSDEKLRRDPESQLLAVTQALKRLDAPLARKYRVGDAELQVALYYRNKVRGEPDFLVPSDLLELLVRCRVGLRVTVLP